MYKWLIDQVGSYPIFCSMRRLGVFLLVFLLSPRWVGRISTVKVKCLGQENTTQCPRLGLELTRLDPEANASNTFNGEIL